MLIQVTPENLRAKATELRGYKSEHDAAIKKITNLINSLPDEFKGQAASAYIEKFNGMQSTFTSFAENLDYLSAKLDSVANEIEAADLNSSK